MFALGRGLLIPSNCKGFMNNRRMLSIIRIFGIGVFIGIANVVPGVSGGTIAVICNVYDKLVILSSFNLKQIRRIWKDILSLTLGIGAGILLFAKLMTILYTAYPVQTSFFFLGIILGSIPFLYQKIRTILMDEVSGRSTRCVSAVTVLCTVLGCALMLWMFFLKRGGVYAPMVVTVDSAAALKRAVWGVLAAAAMLLPGISGSFVLVVLGAYQTVLQAVAGFNMQVLLPFGFGVLVGLIVAARLITMVFEKFPAQMYGFILGLVAGSMLYLYPASCQPFSMRILSAIALFAGYSTVTFFSGRASGNRT